MFTEAYLDIIRYMEMGGDVLWYIGLVCFMWTRYLSASGTFKPNIKSCLMTSKWEGRSERSSWTAHQVRDGSFEGAGKIAGSYR